MKRVVLVCGGRNYGNRKLIFEVLDSIHANDPIKRLIQGGARGADTLALDWAIERKIAHQTYKANWERDGGAAGPKRNQTMIDIEKPDLVLCFPGGAGTADMKWRAISEDITTVDIKDTGQRICVHWSSKNQPALSDVTMTMFGRGGIGVV